jgi:hypothetical protein
VAQLVAAQWLVRESMSTSGDAGGYKRHYDVYGLGPRGFRAAEALRRGGASAALGEAVVLAVPAAFIKADKDARARAARAAEAEQKRIRELAEAGIDVSCIPPDELKSGRGPAISAFRQWATAQKRMRGMGKDTLADAFLEILARVRNWRDATAATLRMAPVNVLSGTFVGAAPAFPALTRSAALSLPPAFLVPAQQAHPPPLRRAEHMMRNIAYTLPSSAESLRAVGVRVAGVDALAARIRESVTELAIPVAGAGVASGASSAAASSEDATPLTLPRGVFSPRAPWRHAEEAAWSTKTTKKGAVKRANWLLSYERFARKESCEAIAMRQASGRAIKAATVQGHVLTALTHGKPVEFKRFAPSCVARSLYCIVLFQLYCFNCVVSIVLFQLFCSCSRSCVARSLYSIVSSWLSCFFDLVFSLPLFRRVVVFLRSGVFAAATVASRPSPLHPNPPHRALRTKSSSRPHTVRSSLPPLLLRAAATSASYSHAASGGRWTQPRQRCLSTHAPRRASRTRS